MEPSFLRDMQSILSEAYNKALYFFLLMSAVGMGNPQPIASPCAAKTIEVSVTILYDNNPFDRRLKTEWGFSCLVRGVEKTILFDTGGNGDTLLGNMKKLGIEPGELDNVVLSHIHGDHTGGLAAFLQKNPRVVVHLPASFPGNFKKAVSSSGAQVEEIDAAREISPGVYTTGELGDGIREQALALKTTEGLVVITGCAHPGIVNIVRVAKEITGQDTVSLVVGGFHLGVESPSRIELIAKELRLLSVKRLAPCHCSGEQTRKIFKKEFGSEYIECGVGKRIEMD
jgi:7,8-dihydropterin-6-yl-methyl-4-(beta-D-ribofuranosyl)aminobenzene 5'-phosphate synthase